MKSISVVVVSFHTGPILFKSISSVLAQKNVAQIIVVDNGNPAAVVDALEIEFSADERFQLITGHGNIGFSKACNLAAERATADLLLLLNPDCIITEDGINSLLQVAESCSGKWMLAPRLVNPDRTEQRGGRREILTPWMAFVEGTKLYKILPNHPYFKRFNHHDPSLPTEVAEIPVTSGACMLLKTSLYCALGGMDEGYFLHVEDIDFCLRFRKAGGKIYFCPQVSFVHALGSSDASRLFVEWHKSIGFKRYFRLHFTGIYPSGFISLVNGLVTVRFALIAVKELLFGLVRPRRQPDLEISTEEVGPVSFNRNESLAEKDVAYNSAHAGHPSDQISSPDSYV